MKISRILYALLALVAASQAAIAAPRWDHAHPYLDVVRFHGGAATSAGLIVTPPPSNNYVYRGNMTHGRLPKAFSTDTKTSTCSWTEHTSSAPIGTAKFPVYNAYVDNALRVDMAYSIPYNYGAAVIYPYSPGVSASTPQRFKWSGSAAFSPSAAGVFPSDPLTLNTPIPVNAPYLLGYCQEAAAGSAAGAGTMPVSGAVNSYYGQLYEIVSNSSTSQLSSGFLDTAPAPTAFSPAATQALLPPSLLVLEDPAIRVAEVGGDSISDGSDDGNPPQGLGIVNLSLDTGWPEKLIHGRWGHGIAGNISKGGDSCSRQYDSGNGLTTNIRYRSAFSAILNPTDYLMALSHNDYTETPAALLANCTGVISLMRTVIPNANFVASTALPDSSGAVPATRWGQTSDQTATPAFIGSGSVASWNAAVRSMSIPGIRGWIEAGNTISVNQTTGAPAQDSGIWKASTITTTLSAPMTAGAASINVTAPIVGCPTTPNIPFAIQLGGSEEAWVMSGFGGTTLTIVPGVSGSNPAGSANHNTGDLVQAIQQYTDGGTHPDSCGSDYIAANALAYLSAISTNPTSMDIFAN